MPPKKKSDSSKKGTTTSKDDDSPGKDPAALLTSYKKICVTIGLPLSTNDPVILALKGDGAGETDKHGKQIVISAREGQAEDALLGPGRCRALALAISGRGHGLPLTESGEPIAFTLATDLRICRSRIGDDGTVAVADMLRLAATELNFLELMDCRIESRGAFALGRSLCCAANTTLTSLRLDHNINLKSEGLAALCQGLCTNSTLKNLSAQYCNIDAEGAKIVVEMLSFTRSTITSLNLSGNHLGGHGLATLSSQGLPPNSSLVELLLADNGIRSSVEDVSALKIFGEAVSTHPTLTTIDLLHNYIGDEGGRVLLPSLQDNKRVHTIKIDPKSVLDETTYNALNRCSASSAKGKKTKGGKGKKKIK